MAAVPQAVELADAEQRPYQQAIARTCYGRNSLVVLPTGLGKTIIAALIMARHLEDGERVLVLAPTRPLVDQHASTFRAQLPDADVTLITGDDRPEDRDGLWADAHVAVATPQVVRNDLLADRLDPTAWGLLVVDEAHRAVGSYAAVPVAQELRAGGTRVLGATASPGSDAERIQEVCDTLGIEHVEARGPWDDDVAPYVDPVSLEWIRVGLPNTLEQAASSLRTAAEDEVEELRSMGLYTSRFLKRTELLQLRDSLRDRLDGATKQRASRALSHVARALRLLHGVKLVETQSTTAARSYLDELLADDETLARIDAVRDARRALDAYMGEHPKMRRCASELQNTIAQEDDARALVFVQTRATADALVNALDQRATLEVGRFVGQSGPDGMTQREQLDQLDAFRSGEIDVLVATSVGEEGLDIPNVDLVLFYEAVPSAIRTIQRRGRTGRGARGRVVVLMARGTADEAAYWSATRRERRMRTLIEQLQERTSSEPEPRIRSNPSANPAPDPDGPYVLVDHRELNSSIARLVKQRGLRIEPTHVPIGDLVLSQRVAVERKTAEDFVRSLVDGRLMEQARALKRSYEAPILVVEGDPLEARGRVSEEAIAGAMAALTGSFGLAVLTVRDTQQAATMIAGMAKREHEEDAGPPALRNETPGRSLEERQRFLLEGLPNVSATLAERLLEHFGTPAAVLAADTDDLQEVHGIGPQTASTIGEVLHAAFETPWRDGSSTSTTPPASTTPSGPGPGRSAS